MGDYNGKTYEYVTKTELKPVKRELDSLIKNVQSALKKEGITFQPVVVGSAGRNLVTRIVEGNKGFDFDYNLVLQKSKIDNPKKIRDLFINAINNAIKETKYSPAENGKQTITIKVIDKTNSKILRSCDFAIVKDCENKLGVYQKILINNKESKQCIWNDRPNSDNYASKARNIIENGYWEELKVEYLKLKNENKSPEKKSFSLYFEALNNIYNNYEWN